MTRATIALIGLLVFAGCGGGRKIVVKPDESTHLNTPDWTIRNTPRPAEPPAAD